LTGKAKFQVTAPSEILKLVQRFAQNREAYESGQYKEHQLRIEFIDPFFRALGWDVANEKGYAEAYKDVIHEDALKIGGATEAPDACFRVGGARKFFVECKKPSVSIRNDIHPAYQLRRYGWSAKLPLSILTDFEEFAVYDCRVRPVKTDSAATARVLYVTCEQYADKWDELAAIFSRDAVLTGSFDKLAETSKAKKGTADVDDAFLEEIERWRDVLARNIAIRNPNLTSFVRRGWRASTAANGSRTISLISPKWSPSEAAHSGSWPSRSCPAMPANWAARCRRVFRQRRASRNWKAGGRRCRKENEET
jgi:hypothetical protein